MQTHTDIKICGIKDRITLDAALTAGASHVGFVHFGKSPRHLPVEAIRGLVEAVPPGRTAVILLVNPTLDLIRQFDGASRAPTIQLHGTETPADIAQWRAAGAPRFWKAIGVAHRDDIARAGAFAELVELVLFDAKPPAGSELPGGNGTRLDWSALAGLRAPYQWGLAGGLDAGNVCDALRMTGASLVDVSSGVESAPGVKDMDKIAAFCEAVAAS